MMSIQIAYTPKGPIEYRFEGSGPTILVLNGGHCSRDTRLSHERLVQHGFSVLTPSRPGYDSTPDYAGKSAIAAADALAALLDNLQVQVVDVIGISAAGPTALAFAQQHPDRIRKLILESAVTTDWDEQTKKRSRIGFGRMEKITWAFMHLMLKLFPIVMIKALLHDLTVLDVDEVLERMSKEDLIFIKRMLQTSRSGTGFMNDIEHHVDRLDTIAAPVLVMYSPHDRTVSSKNALRVADEIKNYELYAVNSDTHLIWIGKTADEVSQKRLSFLKE
jgi:Predicted hydrolases or acyltransferases (alpha/beta hydrolase superfamily)